MKPRSILALLGFLSVFQVLSAAPAPAEPTALTAERFIRLDLEAGRTVDAIRLLDADESGSGFVAWLEGSYIYAASADELPVSAATPRQASPHAPGFAKGKVQLTWRKNEIQRGLYDVARSSRFVFADKKEELELSYVLLPGGADVSYRGAVAWRVRRGGKVFDSGSAVFALVEGTETPVTLQGRSEPAFTAKFLVSPR